MKKIIIMLLTVILCCSFSPVYVKAVTTTTTTLITSESNPELWERFLKYDLCILDYDSLDDEEKSLCKFIFETERSSEDTIICERARRILAGYDVGERINPEKIKDYYNIIDRCDDYWQFTSYPNSDDSDIEIFREQYETSKKFAIFDTVPDIRHIDDNNCYNEYWIDNERTASIEIYNNSYFSSDEKSFVYKVYNNDSYEKYEIEKNLEPLTIIEYENCKYQICADNTLALYSFNEEELDSVNIPETINDMEVTGIKMFAFDKSEVTSVHLPKTITYIEPFAFYKCKNLCNINFPENLKSIAGSGFCECTALDNININCPNLKFSKLSFYNCSANNMTVNTKVVPDFFVNSFEEYNSITLGNNVKEISCSLLNENIEIPETVKIITWGIMPNGVTIIPKHIEILGAYQEAKGNRYNSVSIGGDAEIPLLENKSMTEESNSTIRGYYGTEAHNYALAHNSKFIPLDDILYGDTNKDEKINIADLVLLQDYLLHNSTIDYEADMNKDGRINVFDLISIKKYITKNIEE